MQPTSGERMTFTISNSMTVRDARARGVVHWGWASLHLVMIRRNTRPSVSARRTIFKSRRQLEAPASTCRNSFVFAGAWHGRCPFVSHQTLENLNPDENAVVDVLLVCGSRYRAAGGLRGPT